MSTAIPEVQVETSEASIIANTTGNIADTATAATTTTTTTTTTIITTTATTTTTATISDVKEEKEDTGMNSILPCAKSEDQENEQSHSDITANCTAISNAEKCSTPVAAGEKEGLVQSSNRNAVAEDGAIADHANINRPENIDAMLTFETENTAAVASVTANLQNSADSFKLNKVECNTCDSTEHNLKSVSDQTSKSEVTTPTGLAVESQINTTAAIVESSDAAFKPSGREKEENDLKNKRVEGTDEDREKENSYSEGDYQIKEEFTSLDEKEASSDEADHFVDAKSSTQISGASGDDAAEIGEEIKEQIEEIQDEEGYEYDEEEQEAEPDDDEVESNPAFIPKSGRYYMHDSRNTDEERTPEPSSHSRADGKWKHDRFDERSQRPKTKRELMNRYGYDIRNEGKNTDGGGVNPSTPHSNQTRGTSRGGSSGGNIYGNRGRNSTRAPSHHPQHQPDRRDHRRPIQNSGAGRPANRGGRKSDHRLSMNHQKDHGTRVFKNSPINAQKGATNRTNNQRTHDRSEEYLRDNRQNSGGNRGRGGGTGASGGDPSTVHAKGSAAHTGGKRYSTQRLATNYAPNIQQALPPQPPPPLQPAPTAGPIPIPPPDWRPPAYQGPPPPSTVPPPPPPPIAIPAPVPNFRPSDIVYFDPQPQQLFRTNPIPPRTKKRLEIVPPYQAKNSN